MDDHVDELKEWWSKGVDIRDAWKELIPEDERAIFDNLNGDSDNDYWEEAAHYQTKLITSLRRGIFTAIGRTGPEADAEYKVIPQASCYKNSLHIDEGRLRSVNLNLESVVVLFMPRKTNAESVEVPDDCKAELTRLLALSPRVRNGRGRFDYDKPLLEAARGLHAEGIPIHRGSQQKAIDKIICWLNLHMPDEFPAEEGSPCDEVVRRFIKNYDIVHPKNPINPK